MMLSLMKPQDRGGTMSGWAEGPTGPQGGGGGGGGASRQLEAQV